MTSKLLATAVAVAACLTLAGGAEGQDLASTTAAMGAAAAIGAGAGSSARALDTARGAGPGTRGLEIDEDDASGKGAAAEAASGGAGEAGKGAAKGERGLYLDDDDDDDGPDFVGTAPDEYQVRKGDTLWDLCGRYMGDPWAWPRVWAMNPSVTNPHWIFPGDRLRFGGGGGGKAVAAAPTHTRAPRLTITRTGGSVARSLLLRTNGFVTTKELAGSSKLIGSREEKELLSIHDQVYVEFPQDKPLKVGERYTIYRPLHAIKHPVSGATVGSVVEIIGEVRIEQITQGRIARDTILEILAPVERGHRVGPLLRQLRAVDRRPNKVQLDAYLLGVIRGGQMIGSTQLVFVDKGRKDGVEEGNLFYVIRRGDGNRPIMERIGADQDSRFPKEVIAEIIVVEVREETAVGWVTRSAKEIKLGDKLEMRKGY